MPSQNEMVINYKNMEGGESFKIAVGESEKGKYIILPLYYDLEVSPMDEKGRSIPISSIMVNGTDTIVKTPRSTALVELDIARLRDRSKDRSNTDPTGTTSPPDDDECGDGFIDWIGRQTDNMDEKMKDVVQNARRKIVFETE
jgi:hypothetical protein